MTEAVDTWFEARTFPAERWSLPDLVRAKGDQRVAVVIPARDEEATVGGLVSAVRRDLVDGTAFVDELVVIDSDSTDRTAQVAARAGARVHRAEAVLPHLGRREGKGEAMWKSLAVTSSEIVVFLDADLTSYSSSYVTGLVGPLLVVPEVQLVKAAYDRTLALDGRITPGGGGRVTELMARPLLNALWPELAGLVQPLAGEYAARREALERVPFSCGYGVEIGLLVDLLELYGLAGFAQVDLGVRGHRNKPDTELAPMAAAVLNAALRRLPDRGATSALTTFHRTEGVLASRTLVVDESERPPAGSLDDLRVAG